MLKGLIGLAFFVTGWLSAPLSLAAEPQQVLGDFEFLQWNERTYLVGMNEHDLQVECGELQDYARMYYGRNKITSELGDCSLLEDPQAVILHGSSPTYTYERTINLEKLRQTFSAAIDVTDIVPKRISQFTIDRPRDGVCYNSALVDSGLLPASLQSHFVKDIRYLIGMKGLQVQVNKQGLWTGSYGLLSDSPAVKNRFVFEVNTANKESVKNQLAQTLQNHFTPGSVMCINSAPLTHLKDLADKIEITNENLDQLIKSDSSYLENQGGHCLTLMTRSLVADSNQLLPYNLVSWDVAFEWIVGLMKDFETTGTIFYFELNEDRSRFAKWLNDQVNSHPQLQSLLELARAHREFYQDYPIESCRENMQTQVLLYDEFCWSTHPQLKKDLTTFWKNHMLPTLLGKEFAHYEKIRLTNQSYLMQGPDDLAQDIYNEMMYRASILGLVKPAEN